MQGGHVVLRTAPRASVHVDGQLVGVASERGLAVIGFDRDAPLETNIAVHGAGQAAATELSLRPGDFDVQRVGGLPQNTVAPSDPELLARIQREAALKQAAYASRWDGDAFAGGFAWPVEARVSGRFGGQRILNGTPSRPHYGVDLACSTGTPVRAPAAGLVVLAEPDLHYEGGLVFMDHGQGLVSAYLHLSEIACRVGEVVEPGRRLGAAGARGRATGPHLCWRLKWRGRNLDPSLLVS